MTATAMTSSARRHFVATQQVVPALINALINGAIAWAMHRGTSALALWGDGGYAVDLLATGFLLPAITWLILHPLLRRQARAGKGPELHAVATPRLAAAIPGTLWRGAVVCGLLGSGLGLVAVMLLHAAGTPAPDGAAYAVGKGLYGAALAVILQPAMVFAALRRPAA